MTSIVIPTAQERYHALAQESLVTIASLAPNQVAQRYYEALTQKFDQLAANRADIAQFFSAAMQDETPRGVFKDDAMREVFDDVVRRATDAPTKPDDFNGLSHLLYALYLLCVLFWLYDRTPSHKATAQLLDFMREMIRMLRPMMMMPLFTKAMLKMTTIMEMVFE